LDGRLGRLLLRMETSHRTDRQNQSYERECFAHGVYPVPRGSRGQEREEIANPRGAFPPLLPGEGRGEGEQPKMFVQQLGPTPACPHPNPLLFEPEPEAQPQSRRPEGEGVGGASPSFAQVPRFLTVLRAGTLR